jgi:hypothetical protein
MPAETPAVAETTPAPSAETPNVKPPEGDKPAETAPSAPTAPSVSQKEKNRQAFAERAKRRSERDRLHAETVQRQADQRVAEATARVEAAEKARQAAEDRIARYDKDPIVEAARSGKDVEASIKSFISETAPEKLIRAQNERIEAQAEELRSIRKSVEEREQQAAARNVAYAIDSVAQSLTDDAKFPHVNLVWEPAQIRAKVQEIHEWGVKNGKAYSLKEIQDYLEHHSKELYTRAEERRERIRARLKGETPASATEKAPASNGQTPRQPAPETRKLAAPTTRTVSPAEVRRSRTRQREAEEAADVAILKAAAERDRASVNGVSPALGKKS